MLALARGEGRTNALTDEPSNAARRRELASNRTEVCKRLARDTAGDFFIVVGLLHVPTRCTLKHRARAWSDASCRMCHMASGQTAVVERRRATFLEMRSWGAGLGVLCVLFACALSGCAAEAEENPNSIPGKGSGPCAARVGVYAYTYFARGTGTCGAPAGDRIEGVWNFDATGAQTNSPSECVISDATISDDRCVESFNARCTKNGNVSEATTQITWSRDGTRAKMLNSQRITLNNGTSCSEVLDGTASKQ